MSERMRLLEELRRRVGHERAVAIHVAISASALTAHGLNGAHRAELMARSRVDDVAILRALVDRPDDELTAIGDRVVAWYRLARGVRATPQARTKPARAL